MFECTPPLSWTHVLLCLSLGLGATGCGGGDDDDDDHHHSDAGVDASMGDAGHPLDPRFQDLADAIEGDLDVNNATAASVSVWLDGEIVWVGGFGEIAGQPGLVDEDTLFMIGSDTKKITALALLQLVQAGGANLDTTVAEVLPDLEMQLAPGFVDATIHDLISHQGGIVDGVEGATEAHDDGLRAFTYGTFARDFYPMAPPGRIWNYSNPNFSVAGLVDETLDGRPWADIVEEDLFAPLGMTRTVARKDEVDDNRATGVGISLPGDEPIEEIAFEDTWESAFVRPAGLVWSTPSDQMRLARFIVDGDESVLSDALRETVSTQQVPFYPDLEGGYGYGLMIDRGLNLRGRYYDIPLWIHGGNTLTHTSTFYVLPDQRFAISILSNGQGDNFVESLVTAIETLVPDLPAPVQPPTPPFDADALDDLVGSYYDDFNVGELIFTRDGDSLRVEAPTLDDFDVPYEHEMRAVSTRVWIVNAEGADLDFAFIDGPDGETYFRNRAIVAIRPPPEADARHRAQHLPEHPRPHTDAASLRRTLVRARMDADCPLRSPLTSPLPR